MHQLGDEDPEENVDALYGHFDVEQARTNGEDDRKNFLRGKPTNVLYWWKVLDQLQLITLTCVAMRKELGASSSSRPISISTMQKEKKRLSKKRKEFQHSVASELTNMAEKIDSMNSIVDMMVLQTLLKRKVKLDKKLYVTSKDSPEEYKQILRDELEKVTKYIENKEKET